MATSDKVPGIPVPFNKGKEEGASWPDKALNDGFEIMGGMGKDQSTVTVPEPMDKELPMNNDTVTG